VGRPRIEIDLPKLKALCRLRPTLADVAAFFECSEDTIEKVIRREFSKRFTEFRDQNMVETRFMLIRTALQQAKTGNTAMLIFCLKNLCGWVDKQQISTGTDKPFELNYKP